MFPQRHLRWQRTHGYFGLPHFTLKTRSYAHFRRKTVSSSEKTVLCDSFSQTDRFKTEFRVLNGNLDVGWYAVHVIRLHSS